MKLRVFIVCIISVVLQSCGNFGNFNTQKYTSLKFKKSTLNSADELLVQNDSVFRITQVSLNPERPAVHPEEVIEFRDEEDPQESIDDQHIEKNETSSQHISKSSIAENKTKRTEPNKRRPAKKILGWFSYLIGGITILAGIAAPLFATVIGWWMILIAIPTIFVGLVIITVGTTLIDFYEIEWRYTPYVGYFFGLIGYAITAVIGIVLLLL